MDLACDVTADYGRRKCVVIADARSTNERDRILEYVRGLRDAGKICCLIRRLLPVKHLTVDCRRFVAGFGDCRLSPVCTGLYRGVGCRWNMKKSRLSSRQVFHFVSEMIQDRAVSYCETQIGTGMRSVEWSTATFNDLYPEFKIRSLFPEPLPVYACCSPIRPTPWNYGRHTACV